MTTLSTPGANQPVDYDFISTLVNRINEVSGDISEITRERYSSINATRVFTPKVAFYTTTVKITKPSANDAYSSFTVTFKDVSFSPSVVPTVVATANADVSNSSFTITLFNISNTGCSGRIIWGIKPSVDINVNVVAIGTTP